MIKPATPIQMRDSLNIVETMRRAGVRFVPVPVLSEEDCQAFLKITMERLEKLEMEAEKDG